MAIRLRNLSTSREFISENDPTAEEGYEGKEKPTVFHIRPLSSSELAYLNDRMASVQIEQEGEKLNRKERRAAKKQGKGTGSSQSTRLNIFDVALDCVRGAVTGIDGLLDANGKPMQVALVDGHFAGNATQVLPDSVMEAFDPDVALEIFEFVMDADQVSEEEGKN